MRRFHIGTPEWAPPRVPLQLPLGYGSLGWLVNLVRKQRLNLMEVDLAPIAQACYDYWQSVGDLDEASDALAVLASLTERKAQRLLMPDPEPETEPEWDGVFNSLPQHYLQAVAWLREREGERAMLFFRGMPVDTDAILLPDPEGAELPDRLWLALRRLLQRVLPVPDAIPERRYFSIHARMVELRQYLSQSSEPIPFDNLVQTCETVLDLLVWFLAMLELWRLEQVSVTVDESNQLWLEPVGTAQAE
ncbi:MAG: segregation/condensation protein A [Fimbriimonadales bacterium]